MLEFIHLSDPHFHSKFEDNEEVVVKLKYIAKEFPNHKIIVTGDITDDGHKTQYKQAALSLHSFVGRIFFCPGNHDFGRKGNLYSKNCVRRFNKYLMPLFGQTQKYGSRPVVNVLKDPDGSRGVMLIGLNSALRTKNPFDFACGRIGLWQRLRLDRILMRKDTIGMRKIIYFHHHPFEYFSFFGQMLDARKLMRLLFAKCEVVLFGHKHKLGIWTNYNFINCVLAADDLKHTKVIREISMDRNGAEVREHLL